MKKVLYLRKNLYIGNGRFFYRANDRDEQISFIEESFVKQRFDNSIDYSGFIAIWKKIEIK